MTNICFSFVIYDTDQTSIFFSLQIQDVASHQDQGQPRAVQVPLQRGQADRQGRLQLPQVQEGRHQDEEALHMDPGGPAAPKAIILVDKETL